MNITEIAEKLLKDSESIENDVIAIRRILHENPELPFQETNTSRLIEEKLRSLGIQTRRLSTTVIGLIDSGKPGKTVALRVQISALPITEKTNLQFSSKIPGIMHACGHDANVAMLLGAAQLLVKNKDLLSGKVKLIFQAGEEEDLGAKEVISNNELDDVDYVFGLHVSPFIPSGFFATRKGALMPSSSNFKIRVKGLGGHVSSPHSTLDPIFISAQIVNLLHGLTSRIVNPLDGFTLSITSIHSGTKSNIIPDEAVMEGTVRGFDVFTIEKVKSKIKSLVDSLCKSFNADCEVTFSDNCPPLINYPEITSRAMDILSNLRRPIVEIEPVMLADDFSRYLQLKPGCYIFIGTRNLEKGCIYPTHSPMFKLDEDILKYGSAALALLAISFSKEESTFK
ncbi:amidohydrolase [Acidianus infernus]|uniref:Amidohydrolase n=1 Tax=Acidianus infernus TaxID=12915 RepID=A0A6A9QF77_ACIIN|nr:carboxypeptidase CpsA [Acidianus infernus]MUM64814.1 amidohydrolase [Acidianus infernus]